MRKKIILILLFSYSFGLVIFAKRSPTRLLKEWLVVPVAQRCKFDEQSFINDGLSKQDVNSAITLLYRDMVTNDSIRLAYCWKQGKFTRDSLTMKFRALIFGKEPIDGRSLYISLHGGGSCPSIINDGQWDNQILLYQPKEGIYLAPRAPEDAWNMWFKPYVDDFFQDIIESAVILYHVNPDKVYITGYSAGGDGIYRMAPRMADRWAAAAMFAGHPGNVSLLSTRNLPFALWVGALDNGYDRNIYAKKRMLELDTLHKADPEGYITNLRLVEEKGHWMDRLDTTAVNWMAKFKRDPYPNKIVWMQDSTDLNSSLYWLSAPKEKLVKGGLIIVSHKQNDFYIEKSYCNELILGLNDRMINFDKPVRVIYQKKIVFKGKVKRNINAIYTSLKTKKDVQLLFSSYLKIILS